MKNSHRNAINTLRKVTLMDKNSSRVLIVDDLPVNRMILSSLLASHGVMSDQADGGYKCLELARKNDYDLILLDHRMPDLDGVDTLTELKEIFKDKGRSVPVICHTSDEGSKNINLYKAAGFADVLIKPIDPAELSDVIMTYLPAEGTPVQLGEPTNTAIEDIPSAETGVEEDARDELDKLPLWLKIVPHIDLSAGINACGSAEDYVDALYIFRSSIDEKSDDIEKHLDREDWTMYRLGVHSLKSMSRLVGARDLANMAASLEELTDKGETDRIRQKTPELLTQYRQFKKRLDPLMDDKDIQNLMTEATDKVKESDSDHYVRDLSRHVLFVQTNQGIVTKGIEKILTDHFYTVISVPDSPDVIINYRFDVDIIIYYPELGEDSHIGLTMNLLSEICQDDSKIMCLIGDSNDLEIAMESKGAYRVSRTYSRPVDSAMFIEEMEYFSDLLKEYHRMKTVYIVDDDPDYLSIIERWLSAEMNVSSFSCAEDMLTGIEAVTPDLILLDYEMPGMDGFELMKKLRSNPETSDIPIIFLTGKNDRDHVFSILHYKPDGYLLKSSSRDMLIDSINRFFAETLFRMSMAKPNTENLNGQKQDTK